MKVKIVKCSDWMYWYHNQIHEVYTVYKVYDDGYIVRADDGFLNVIRPQDCEIVVEDKDAL